MICEWVMQGLVLTRTPKQEWTQAQQARIINLQRGGEKASLNLQKRFRLLVFKEKSYTCNNAEKHPRSCPSSVINSLEFFLFTVVFLRPFFLSSFFFFFLPPSFSLNSFSCYIPWFSYHFHHPRVSQVLEVSLSHLAPP